MEVVLFNDSKERVIRVKGNIIDIVRHSEVFIVYVLYVNNGVMYLGEVSDRFSKDSFFLNQEVILKVHIDGRIFIEEMLL